MPMYACPYAQSAGQQGASVQQVARAGDQAQKDGVGKASKLTMPFIMPPPLLQASSLSDRLVPKQLRLDA